jgi:hypothetical protein
LTPRSRWPKSSWGLRTKRNNPQVSLIELTTHKRAR